MYGLKSDYVQIQGEDIESIAQGYGISLADWYELSDDYYEYINSFDEDSLDEEMKNHVEPLQLLYYNAQGELVSFHINCYTGGFPNLKWDRDRAMQTFVPKQQAPLDNLLPLDSLYKYILPSQHTETFSASKNDYTVVVFWADYMGRQSKRLIKYAKKNVALAPKDNQVKVIYVNVDNATYKRKKEVH